jgi:hypothetical protein
MSAFPQHPNVTALAESHATVRIVQSFRSNNGALSDAGEGVYLRDAHRHIVRGQVLEVFIVQGGKSVPYDWKRKTG